MRKILSRTLLNYSTNDLFGMLTGDFVLVFDDGVELITNSKETVYSSYAWDLIREYPNTPLLSKHHVKSIIKDGRLGSKTHLTLVGNVMWTVYDSYVQQIANSGETEIRFRDALAKRVYEIVNIMYNELTTKLEMYAVSLDITDFINVLSNPEIKAANDTVKPTQASIDETHTRIKNALFSDVTLENNPIAIASRGKLVNIDQVLQCISARGFITDTDSVLFKTPITRGFTQGLRTFHDSFIESRSAAKSLIFSKTPLQQAEYFSRRLQLMSQIVKNLHMCDCGSDGFLLWHVRGDVMEGKTLKQKGDLENLAGKYYIEADGSLKAIKQSDKHLIGKTLKLRTVIHCAHPDPYGVCSTCFGELSYSVPEHTNIGQMCCTSLAQKSSQKVLSVKHLDGSSVVEGITLTEFQRGYLKVSVNNNSYMLADCLKNKKIKLIIPHLEASNITDIMEVKSVNDLNITRVSELSELGVMIDDVIERFRVNINQRYASMTYAMLSHIRKNGWAIDELGNYVIDMTDWDWSKEILTLPLRHFNMSDHSRFRKYA